jgi:hypothetical protein
MQFVPDYRAGCMTRKTLQGLIPRHRPPKGGYQRIRFSPWNSQSEIQTLNLVVKTQPAFVKITFIVQNVCLTGLALSERVEYWNGDRIFAVTDRINALVPITHQLPGIFPQSKLKALKSAEDSRFGNRLHRPAHRALLMDVDPTRVTFGAGLLTNKLSSDRHPGRSPDFTSLLWFHGRFSSWIRKPAQGNHGEKHESGCDQ